MCEQQKNHRLIVDVHWVDGCYVCEWFDRQTRFVSRFYGTREQCLEEAKRKAPSDPLWVELRE